MARDLRKKQALDTIQAIYQITFAGHLKKNVTLFFIIEEVKETILYFSQGTLKLL